MMDHGVEPGAFSKKQKIVMIREWFLMVPFSNIQGTGPVLCAKKKVVSREK